MPNKREMAASEIDQIVGDRIRRRRILLGFTQDQLGEALGISYQQIQKYETGANRVSAGRLFQIAETLETQVGWFFDGIGEDIDDPTDVAGQSPRHVIELVRGFSKISEDRLRMAVLALVRALGESGAVEMPDNALSGNGVLHRNGDGDARP